MLKDALGRVAEIEKSEREVDFGRKADSSIFMNYVKYREILNSRKFL